MDGRIRAYAVAENRAFRTPLIPESTYTSAQAWKEKASAIRTLEARVHEYCSNEELTAQELDMAKALYVP